MTPDHPRNCATHALTDKARARAIFEYLSLLQEAETLDIAELEKILFSLRAETGNAEMRQTMLEKLFIAFRAHLKPFLRRFADIRIPLDRNFRHQTGILQGFLDNLAATHETLLEDDSVRRQPEIALEIMERIAFCLYQHIYVSHLVVAPVQTGIWQRLHGIHLSSLRLPLAPGRQPPLASYREALLLAAAQPTSCAAHELEFVAEYAHKCADTIFFTTEMPQDGNAVFWVEPTHDFALFALTRRSLPSGYRAFYFSTAKAAERSRKDLEALDAGATAESLHLPKLAQTPAGQGALRRLATAWSAPGKRHFPRRRQANHRRARLCAGLARFRQLLQKKDGESEVDISQWMIINESPDGYALMHMSGTIGHVRIGDVVALRPDANPGWLVCLVRWAISENPEHIEIGLQIIALDAIPASLVDGESRFVHTPLLLLPEYPSLRSASALVAPVGTITGDRCAIRLGGSKKTRDLSGLKVCEQNSCIEMFTLAE
ncbi:MAG: hypothetical protein LBF51_06670 [Zoogloeaceae bacterium]|jgi:hypothetical protein|nr:hypothetical protein [Zoogloeaceae bacterium]